MCGHGEVLSCVSVCVCVHACWRVCVCNGEAKRPSTREVRERLCVPHPLPTSLSFQLQPESPELVAAALQFSST